MMETFAALGGGFAVALQPTNIFLALIGCIIGSISTFTSSCGDCGFRCC
jgi:TctA family transporter